MNVQLILIAVIVMLPVSTLLAISHVLVTLDIKETESHVQVCNLLAIYMNINNKIKTNNK